MRVSEIAPSGESWLWGERLVILFALGVIVLWGFTGYEYPQTELSGQTARTGVTLAAGAAPGPGAELFQANGCNACHSLEGETIIGPSLLGIFGTTVDLDDGSSVVIDDAYLIESILQPDAKRVAGYGDAAMPSYEGLVSVEDAEALVEFIKSVR